MVCTAFTASPFPQGAPDPHLRGQHLGAHSWKRYYFSQDYPSPWPLFGDDAAPATLRPSPRDAKGVSLLKHPMSLTSSCLLELKMHAISSPTGRDISASQNGGRLLLSAGSVSLRFVNTPLLLKEKTAPFQCLLLCPSASHTVSRGISQTVTTTTAHCLCINAAALGYTLLTYQLVVYYCRIDNAIQKIHICITQLILWHSFDMIPLGTLENSELFCCLMPYKWATVKGWGAGICTL